MVFHNGEPSIEDTIRVVKHPSRFEIATMPDGGVVVTQIQLKGKTRRVAFMYIYIYIYACVFSRGKRIEESEGGRGEWARRCIVWKHLIGQTG